jgi:hypothetical protein
MLKKDQARYEDTVAICVASAITDTVGWNVAKRAGRKCAPRILTEIDHCERSRIVAFIEPIIREAILEFPTWKGSQTVAFDIIAALQAEDYPGLE